MEFGALALLSPTRQSLVGVMKQRGEVTADELAGATYLTAAAVRLHLSALEKLKLVTHSARTRGPGRPQHVYRLTGAGEMLFSNCYLHALGEILEVARLNPELEDRLWVGLVARMSAVLERDVTAAELSGRVEQLAALPQLIDLSPSITESADGSWRIEMNQCPYLRVAQDHPNLCSAEAAVVQRVLGPEAIVVQAGTRPRGDATCSLVVSTAPATADVQRAPATGRAFHFS